MNNLKDEASRLYFVEGLTEEDFYLSLLQIRKETIKDCLRIVERNHDKGQILEILNNLCQK